MTARSQPELLEVPDRAALRAWLEDNHETSPGVLLAITRKGGSKTSLTYEEAVREGLAFGWIDSTAHALDSERRTVLFTRRKPTSTWSHSNKERVADLLRQGLMTPAGIAAVEVAKQNGSWTLLDDIDALTMPDDLAGALDETGAKAAWEAASVSQKRMALYWIASAKRPETRAKRVAAVVAGTQAGRPMP